METRVKVGKEFLPCNSKHISIIIIIITMIIVMIIKTIITPFGQLNSQTEVIKICENLPNLHQITKNLLKNVSI